MSTDSRKAQRNSYAHHRASLLFSNRTINLRGQSPWAATVHEGTEPQPSLTERVRAGLIGFVPVAVVAAN